MAKKRISISVKEDTAQVIDIVKQSIERQDVVTIDNFSSFVDVLIKSFAYQILNDKETFVVQPAKIKEQLLNAGFTPKTFRDIATVEGYSEVENDVTIKKQEKQIKLYKEIIDNLKAEKQDLENDNTKLDNEIKRKEKINAESSVGVSSNDKTPVFSNQNQNAKPKNNKGIGRGKAPKPKYEPPIVDAVRLIYNGQVLADITKDDYKAYIEKTNDEKMAQQKLKSQQYVTKDNEFQITQKVYIELRRVAEQYTDDKLQMELNASDFEDRFKHEENLASDKDKVIAEIELVEDKLNKKVQEFKRKKEKEIEEKLRKQQEQQEQEQEQQQEQQEQEYSEPAYDDEPVYDDDEPTYNNETVSNEQNEYEMPTDKEMDEIEKTEDFRNACETKRPMADGIEDKRYLFYDVVVVTVDDFGEEKEEIYSVEYRLPVYVNDNYFTKEEVVHLLEDEGKRVCDDEEKRERISEIIGENIDEEFMLNYFLEGQDTLEDLDELTRQCDSKFKQNKTPIIYVAYEI